jgi:hypothetical protein
MRIVEQSISNFFLPGPPGRGTLRLGSLAFFPVDVKRGKELRYSTSPVAVHGISVDVPAPGMQQRPASGSMSGHWVPSGKDPMLQQYSRPLWNTAA